MTLTNLLSGFHIVERKISKYNGELTVIKDIAWGTYIKAGGLPQSGGLARKIWKKPLERVKAKESKRVEEILILGFGGGGVVELLKKHWPKASITGVDIDPAIVDLGKRHIKWDDENVTVIIEDAQNFVDKLSRSQKFDLVLIDTYNGDKFPEKFEQLSFARKVHKILSPKGVAVFNRLYGYEDRFAADRFGRMLEKVFSRVETLQPVANIMFICR